MASDASGNVMVVGSFIGTVHFGPITLTSAGNQDVFVAKWSPARRTYTWAQRAGGPEGDEALGVAVNGTGVYVVGQFRSRSADFGPTTLTNPAGGASDDGFIAKLTDAGSTAGFAWAQGIGGSDLDYASAVAVQGGEVYITGAFQSATVDFGSLSLTNSGFGTYDLFVAKLTDAGTFVWVQQAGGSESDGGTALAVAGPNVYVGGSCGSFLTSFGSILLTPVRADGFVAKLTDAGATAQFVWAVGVGGDGDDTVQALAVNGASVYATGAFSGRGADFGSVHFTNYASSGTMWADGFVAKLTDAGATAGVTWARQVGGAYTDAATAIAVRGSALYVCGSFGGRTAQFGPFPVTITNASNDAFLTRLTDAGSTHSVDWVQTGGSTDTDIARAVALVGSSVYIGGNAELPARFGSQLISGPSGVFGVGFLASLTDPALGTADATPSSPAIMLFPNPAHTVVTVQMPPVPGATRAVLTLADALGCVVQTRTVALVRGEASPQLNVAGLACGAYTVQILAGAVNAVQYLVIE